MHCRVWRAGDEINGPADSTQSMKPSHPAYTPISGGHPAIVYVYNGEQIVQSYPSTPESEDRQSALKPRHNAHSFKRPARRGVIRNLSSGRNSTPSRPKQRIYGSLQRSSDQAGCILWMPTSATLSAHMLSAICSFLVSTFDAGDDSPSGL